MLQYPSYAVPQPTTTKLQDVLRLFEEGLASGRADKAEREAPEAFGGLLDSMGGQPNTLSALSTVLDPASQQVVGSHVAATNAQDPVLSAALSSKGMPPAGQVDPKAAEAMQFFIGKGYSPHQAAGIVGNLMHESGLNTAAL